MSDFERPSPEQIRIGRLLRRIERMKKRREHLQAEIDARDAILRYYPQAGKLHEQWRKLDAAHKQVRELTQANREQADTIRALTKAIAALGA
jgi:hypothetical protein